MPVRVGVQLCVLAKQHADHRKRMLSSEQRLNFQIPSAKRSNMSRTDPAVTAPNCPRGPPCFSRASVFRLGDYACTNGGVRNPRRPRVAVLRDTFRGIDQGVEMRIGIRFSVGIGLLLALAACTTSAPHTRDTGVEEYALANELEPAPEPALPKEDTIWYGRGGYGGDEKYRIAVVTVRGNELTVEGRNECHWTYTTEYGWPFFTPAVSFQNCGGAIGSSQRRISGVEGSLWPLQVDKHIRYDMSTASDRRCEVVGTARVATEAGMFDTYKVSCVTGRMSDTFYYAPEVGHFVRWIRKSSTNWPLGMGEIDWQLISVSKP